MITQNEQDILISKEDAYVVMPTSEDELVFALSVKEEEPDDPKILYDNSEHALLYRTPQEVVILDFLHADVQRKLENIGKAFIVEIDYKLKKLFQDYEVPIELVDSYPFDIKPYIE